MNFWITVKKLNERGKKKKCTMQNQSDTWQDLMYSYIWSLILYILAFNPCNAWGHFTYQKTIKYIKILLGNVV